MKYLFLLIFFFLFVFVGGVNAQVVSIVDDGSVVWKVLSEQDSIALGISDGSFLEVKEVANEKPILDAKISLEKTDEGVDLMIISSQGESKVNLQNAGGDLVEIEERPKTSRVKIGIVDGEFAIKQDGVVAKTNYPIKIDSENARIAVSSPTGDRYLYILPQNAVQSVLRSKAVSTVDAAKDINIVEEDGEIVYKLSGQKLLNLFNLYNYPVEVEASVSATTGEIVKTNAPIWLSIVSYLLS